MSETAKKNIDIITMVSFAVIGVFGIALIAGGLEEQQTWKLKFNINDVDYTYERSSGDAMIVWDLGNWNTNMDNSTKDVHRDVIQEHLDDIIIDSKKMEIHDDNGEFMFYLDSPEHEQFCEDNDWHLVCVELQWSEVLD